MGLLAATGGGRVRLLQLLGPLLLGRRRLGAPCGERRRLVCGCCSRARSHLRDRLVLPLLAQTHEAGDRADLDERRLAGAGLRHLRSLGNARPGQSTRGLAYLSRSLRRRPRNAIGYSLHQNSCRLHQNSSRLLPPLRKGVKTTTQQGRCFFLWDVYLYCSIATRSAASCHAWHPAGGRASRRVERFGPCCWGLCLCRWLSPGECTCVA